MKTLEQIKKEAKENFDEYFEDYIDNVEMDKNDTWKFIDSLIDKISKTKDGKIKSLLACIDCDGSGTYQSPSDYGPCNNCDGTGFNLGDRGLDDLLQTLKDKKTL